MIHNNNCIVIDDIPYVLDKLQSIIMQYMPENRKNNYYPSYFYQNKDLLCRVEMKTSCNKIYTSRYFSSVASDVSKAASRAATEAANAVTVVSNPEKRSFRHVIWKHTKRVCKEFISVCY